MAKKLGRNDKCHCGSGKKYKKCCLERDLQQQRKLASQPNEEELLFEPESNARLGQDTHDWGEAEQEYFEDMDESRETDKQKEPASDRSLFKVPKISDAQDELLEDWLERFYSLDDPIERSNSLKTFLQQNPELRSNVAAETGAFLELQDPFMKEQRYSEYINELLFLREQYPREYIHVFGYLDRDIISYLCLKGRTEEIDNYLDLFRTYPDHDPDNLDGLLKFFLTQGMYDKAFHLAQDVYNCLSHDPDLVLTSVMQILTMGCFAPYLNAALREETTEERSKQLVQCLKPYREHLPEKWFKAGYHHFLTRKILDYQKARWTLEACRTRLEVLCRYDEMLIGFMGFLGREKNMHWGVADHFRLLLSDFFDALIPRGKIPKESFPLTWGTITKALKKPVFGIQTSKVLGTLSALNALASYLVLTDSIDAQLGEIMQSLLRQIQEQTVHDERITDLEALALQRYPLF